MPILIAVVNAHTRLAYQQAVRDTWLPLVKEADVRFFLGPSERASKEDEVFLQCDDSYQGLPSKVRAIMRWALDHGYDHVLKLDDDVVLNPEKLLASGFQNYDFVGHRDGVKQFPVPHGFAYWLSRMAMSLVASADLPNNNNDEAWVTRTLSLVGVSLHHDNRYFIHSGRREDFINDEIRPIRVRPPRLSMQSVPATEEVFAYCIHITWAGLHKLPEYRAIEEFKKVFANTRQKL